MKKKSKTRATKPSSPHQNGRDNGTRNTSNPIDIDSTKTQSSSIVGIHVHQREKSTSFPIGSLVTAILPNAFPDATDEGVARMQIDRGSRLIVSNICLDSIAADFSRARVLFRCSNRVLDGDSSASDDAPWTCLCNFNGRTIPMVSLNVAIDGPCSMEWKLDVDGISVGMNIRDSMTMGAHIVGSVQAVAGIANSSVGCVAGESTDRDAAAAERNGAGKGESIGVMAPSSEKPDDCVRSHINVNSISSSNNDVRHDAGDATHEGIQRDDKSLDNLDSDDKKSKKRKLSVSNDDPSKETLQNIQERQRQQTENRTTAPKEQESSNIVSKKLTKTQRKELAEQKSKQLEETLAAARDNTSSIKENLQDVVKQDDGEGNGEIEAGEPPTKKAKKKKKKKKSSSSTSGEDGSDENGKTKQNKIQAKPTSLTSQRRLPNGILLRDILIGTGAPVAPGRRVSIHYTGTLLSTGKVFDKNHSKTHPLVFRQGTGEVIRGLERGLEGMKVGGERVITVPSRFGYGEKGVDGTIPGGEDLVFEVKVLKVG